MDTTTDNNDPAFWLPTHFLTDDDFLAGVDDKKEQPKSSFDLFSNGFGFDPFSVLDSPVSSNGTDKDHENDDHELLAELTRQLARSSLRQAQTHHNNLGHAPTEKPWVFSTSPQSTLTGLGQWSNRSGFTSNGSPSQVASPPLTPPGSKDEAAWELLYEAAGQVAKLKMSAIAAQLNHHNQHQQQQQNRGLLRSSSINAKSPQINSFYDFPATNQYQQLKRQQGSGGPMFCQHHHYHQQSRTCGGGAGGALGLPQSAWPPLKAGVQQPQPHHNHQNHRQQSVGSGMRAVFLGGPGSGYGPGPAVKRQSTGTGVFLPRRVGTQPEPRKKPTGCSTVLLPARVVQALKLDLDEINNGVNHNSQSRFGSGFVTDHEVLVARRNALLNQQRRSMKADGAATMVGLGHDIRLPSDWTY